MGKDINNYNGIQELNYVDTGHIHINHLGCTNAMENIPRFPNQEGFYMFSSNSGVCHSEQRTDQKNVFIDHGPGWKVHQLV